MKVETARRLLRNMEGDALLMIEIPTKSSGFRRYHARDISEASVVASSGGPRKVIIRSEG